VVAAGGDDQRAVGRDADVDDLGGVGGGGEAEAAVGVVDEELALAGGVRGAPAVGRQRHPDGEAHVGAEEPILAGGEIDDVEVAVGGGDHAPAVGGEGGGVGVDGVLDLVRGRAGERVEGDDAAVGERDQDAAVSVDAEGGDGGAGAAGVGVGREAGGGDELA